MAFEIETGVPMEPLEQQSGGAFLCRRGRKPTVQTIRKFLAVCGTKIVFELGIRGEIVSMKPEYPCDVGKNCPHCKDRMEKATILINNGK